MRWWSKLFTPVALTGLLWCFVSFVPDSVSSRKLRSSASQQAKQRSRVTTCECMPYVECELKLGRVYAYCSLDRVCCLLKADAEVLSVEEQLLTRLMHTLVYGNRKNRDASKKTKKSEPSGNHRQQSPPQRSPFNNGTSIKLPKSKLLKKKTKSSSTASVKENRNEILNKIARQLNESTEEGGGDVVVVGSICGLKGQQDVNTGVAVAGEWPWHAAILSKSDQLYLCGGSLIDNQFLLTAAHCLHSHSAKKLKVRLGEFDISGEKEPFDYEEINVKSVNIHPKFNAETLANDIALVKLQRPVKSKLHIRKVCLPSREQHRQWISNAEQSECIVTGWGKMFASDQYALQLKELPVPLWNHERCQKALGKIFGKSFLLSNSTVICAGGKTNDACDGDGGGPLVCKIEKTWFQVGVVSFGDDCGRSPGVYTLVVAYLNWIKKHIGLNR